MAGMESQITIDELVKYNHAYSCVLPYFYATCDRIMGRTYI